MDSQEALYGAFARVLVKIGMNLQQGDTAVVKASPEHFSLVRAVAEACYTSGAKYVYADYEDPALARIRMRLSPKNALSYCPDWLTEYRRAYGKDRICYLELSSPSFSTGEDLESLEEVRKSAAAAAAGFRDVTATGEVSICKTLVPSVSWARQVFPALSAKEALAALWEKYAAVCRLNAPDPVEAWREHQRTIREKKRALAKLKLQKLHFVSDVTDLWVGLVNGESWIGGCAENQRTGLPFAPNIPTEEIFTVPHRKEVNGYVGASLPLNYGGELIKDIRLTVRQGLVTSFDASRGRDLLESILNTDEGARRFGEASLVPVTSPVYQTGLVYYTTLLDENAACHLALGAATPGVLPEGYTLSREALLDRGVNQSSLHVDFMIGSERMDVAGIDGAGKETQLLKQGRWVI